MGRIQQANSAQAASRANREARIAVRGTPPSQSETRLKFSATHCRHVLQVRLRFAAIPRPPQAERPHTLRERPLNPRTPRVQLPARLAVDERPHLPQRRVLRFGRYLQVPALLRRAGTLRPHWAIPAIRGTEPDRDVRAAVRVGVLLPPYAQPASRTTRPLLPPVDREVLAVLPNDRSTTQRRGSRIHSRFAPANNTL